MRPIDPVRAGHADSLELRCRLCRGGTNCPPVRRHRARARRIRLHERGSRLARRTRSARQPAGTARKNCRRGQAHCASCLLGPPAGAYVRRTTCAGHPRSLVPRHRSRQRHRPSTLWRCGAQRQAAHEFSGYGGAGAALLQPIPHRAPRKQRRPEQTAGSRIPASSRAISMRPTPPCFPSASVSLTRHSVTPLSLSRAPPCLCAQRIPEPHLSSRRLQR